MQVASGLVTGLNLVLSLLVGARLLRQSGGRWRAPELHLATYFLVSSFLSTVLQVPAYGSLVDPRLAAFAPHQATLLAGAVFCLQLGTSGVYLFVWRTFRPDRPWARNLAVFGIAAMFVGYLVEAAFEGFAIRIVAGPGHVIGCFGRIFAFVWAAWEALAYYARMRRRERLGLADPVVANRVWLWAMSGVAATLLLVTVSWLAWRGALVLHDPAALLATAAAGLATGVCWYLAFLPPDAYLAWLQRRAA